MTSGFYYPGNSVLHRSSARVKMLLLVLVCGGVFFVDQLSIVLFVAAAVLVLYFVAGLPTTVIMKQMRPVLFILLAIFVVQVLVIDWQTASKIVLRFAALILAASLVTLTTRSSDMLAALEQGIKPLSAFGLNSGKISLALSLTIRLIPTIAEVTAEVREAQRARGLDRSVFAVVVPTIVRTLKMADDIADAIDARCYSGSNERR